MAFKRYASWISCWSFSFALERTPAAVPRVRTGVEGSRWPHNRSSESESRVVSPEGNADRASIRSSAGRDVLRARRSNGSDNSGDLVLAEVNTRAADTASFNVVSFS